MPRDDKTRTMHKIPRGAIRRRLNGRSSPPDNTAMPRKGDHLGATERMFGSLLDQNIPHRRPENAPPHQPMEDQPGYDWRTQGNRKRGYNIDGRTRVTNKTDQRKLPR